MAQNIYDEDEFFATYAQLPRSIDGPDAAAEWPLLRAMLPPLDGARVVDLGCGYGWFCRFAAQGGAAAVLGLDVSEKMLARAAADTTDDRITYRREDLDTFVLPEEAFDLAYSSLTLHYLADVASFFGVVRQALVEGGHLVCSFEHPLFTSPTSAAFIEHDGRTIWPLDRYSDEGPRVTNWLADGVVKQHRTIATYLTALIGAGFVLTDIVDWAPTAADLDAHPDWAAEIHRPPFLLMAARAV